MRLAAPPSTAADIDANHLGVCRGAARARPPPVSPPTAAWTSPFVRSTRRRCLRGRRRAIRPPRRSRLVAAAGTGLTLASPRRADTGASRAVASAVVRDFRRRGSAYGQIWHEPSPTVPHCFPTASIVLVAGDADTHRRFIRASASRTPTRLRCSPSTTSTVVAMVTSIVRRTGVDPARFEFAMPYGARPTLQRRIADRGHTRCAWSSLGRGLARPRRGSIVRTSPWRVVLARSPTDRGPRRSREGPEE